MPVHEHYEELCALAASGDLRHDEWSDLEEHLQNCADCREMLPNFVDLYLTMVEQAEEQFPSTTPPGMKQRFAARAQAVGISFPKRTTRLFLFGRHFQVDRRRFVLTAVALIIATISSFLIGSRFEAKRQLSAAHVVPTPQQQPAASKNGNSPLAVHDELKEQLRKTREQLRESSLAQQENQRALEAAIAESASLKAQISELESQKSGLQGEATRNIAEIRRLKGEVERLTTKANDASLALLADQEEISKLRHEVKVAQDLNATLSEAHDLIVDPNIHLLNVFPEVDQDAKHSQPRGHILYAEGKKLVFYAYDLADPSKISAKASFYLWGEGRTVQRIVSLGRFQIESQEQGRWVLRVTDPRLLAGITSVFVTLEPDKGAVTKPSGKRMLSRLLRSKAD